MRIDELAKVVENAALVPGLRVAAAVALSADHNPQKTRTFATADATADRELAAALEATAERELEEGRLEIP